MPIGVDRARIIPRWNIYPKSIVRLSGRWDCWDCMLYIWFIYLSYNDDRKKWQTEF